MHPSPIENETSQASVNRRRIVPWIISLVFFGVLNETVFNVSTPTIAAEFDLLPSQVSWIITIFIITFGLGSVVYGKLSDMYSPRTLIVIGIFIYNAGSIIGFTLQSWYPAVILGRAIQGAGASAIPALMMIVIARYFSPEERGKLFGVLTSTVSFAVGIGPVIGGMVSASFHWSYLFLISFCTLIALPFIRKELPPEEGGTGKLDIWGTVLMGTCVAALIVALTEKMPVLFVVSALALFWFVVHIRRVAQPFVEPALFAARTYRSGLFIGFIIFCTVMGIVFVVPLMLSRLYGMPTDAIGLVMFPGAFSAVIFGTVAGNLTVKKGSHFVVFVGLALIAGSLVLVSVLTGQWVWLISGALVLLYIGFSFLQTALAESITQILPSQQIGVGMGFYSLVSFISGAVGTALVARVLDQNLFSFPFWPVVTDPQGRMFSNLMLLFAFVIVLSTVLYYFTFNRVRPIQGTVLEEADI